jgi:adenylate cyclase
MEIRVGLAGGRPLERDGYLYGATLNLAARLCAEAPPNGIVTDDEVRRRCASVGTYEELGGLDLKGFPEPVVAHLLGPG